LNLSEHHKRASEYHPRDNNQTHTSATTSAAHSSTNDSSLLPGPAPHTAGPHKKDWMNKLDPFVDSHPYSATSDADILALPVRQGQGSFSEQTIDQDGHHLPKGEVGQEFASSGSGVHSSTADTSNDHHYRRDATIGAAAGGAAYEVEKHHKHDKDLTQAEKDTKKEHKHEVKEEKKERKDSKSGLLGFLRM
jgi:hypothetical protein